MAKYGAGNRGLHSGGTGGADAAGQHSGHIAKQARGHIHPEFMRGKDSLMSKPTGHVVHGNAEHQKFQSMQGMAAPPDTYEEGPGNENESCY